MINKTIFSIVICAHLILILLVLIIWPLSSSAPIHKDLSLPVFVVEQEVRNRNKNDVNPLPSIKKDISTKKNEIQKYKKNLQVKQSISTLKDPKNHFILLALIHKIISKYQTYPKSALSLQQKGAVTIRFTLSPDCHVTNPQVIHSSGHEILDKSALNTLNLIPPISEAKKYLKQPEVFQVDIVFA